MCEINVDELAKKIIARLLLPLASLSDKLHAAVQTDSTGLISLTDLISLIVDRFDKLTELMSTNQSPATQSWVEPQLHSVIKGRSFSEFDTRQPKMLPNEKMNKCYERPSPLESPIIRIPRKSDTQNIRPGRRNHDFSKLRLNQAHHDMYLSSLKTKRPSET
ncbi:hypothetical protein Tcan_17757 [Toxocara canis]|uniref:Uncharacterized protein n=1 Tax=Toxocara canis TaxID=6265 RepID=A0A0B2W5R8_TOXCA|nr:hypothetical protein Tcan_17757 [Toxocara canis]